MTKGTLEVHVAHDGIPYVRVGAANAIWKLLRDLHSVTGFMRPVP